MTELRADLRREADRQAADPARAQHERDFADAARTGALGAGMKRLQERMDRGDFSWEAVITGQVDDPTLTSVAIRSMSRIRDAIAAEALPDQSGESDEDYFDDPMGIR
ncbi:hypothetical protein [Actinokineospora sp.]|uniref:hypothetical protein n=1 Tax=Actinokineospora sp. TaxID=1872133 RepID=UPI003D6C0015